MGKVIKVSGPLVVADGMADANMADVVRVGPKQLIGEILNMTGDRASIQVYEETSGLGPGAEVVTTGAPLSVELGPGLIESIYDGIQRPLEEIRSMAGAHIPRGIQAPPLPEDKKWDFTPVAKPGDAVVAGDVLGTVPETTSVLHKIMVPHRMDGTVEWVAEAGAYTIRDVIAKVRLADGSLKELTMVQKWPVRVGRPYRKKFPPSAPLQTGQRVIDTMFPVAKGGTAAVPGPLLRENGGAASAGQVGGRGHRGLHRLRRAWQRDDGRAAGVPGADGSPHRRDADEADGADRQHLRYACGRP